MEAVTSHAVTAEGRKDHVTPRALEVDEIPGIVEDYKTATRMPSLQASTVWSCTLPTGICWSSSCATRPTSVPTSTAARSTTGRASCLRRLKVSFPWRTQARWLFASHPTASPSPARIRTPWRRMAT
ncbi:hypothetical protein PI125_g21258 [Phytophthora idaei]|nr:hypothetical protein PI125_g21258 [Phytophthora idaei]